MKRLSGSATARRPAPIRDVRVAAPLKRRALEEDDERTEPIRDVRVAAPLKLGAGRYGCRARGLYPRRTRRGPVEAIAVASGATAGLSTIRDVRVAAPLKQGVAVYEEQLDIYPRRTRRGPVEAFFAIQSKPSLPLYPRRTRRGPVEAPLRSSRLTLSRSAIRDVRVAAPLKHTIRVPGRKREALSATYASRPR